MVAQRAGAPPPPGDAGVGHHPAAGRPLLPAPGDRDRPEGGPVLRRDRGADPRRGDRDGPGGPGRHRQDATRGGVHPRPAEARAVDVLVWVTAASREAVVAGFAQAASAVGASDPDADAQAAAGRFTAWLARTERRWALVLDDLADVADLEGLWPAGPNGQVVITTRLPGVAFGAGAHAAASGLRIAPVGGFSRREALSYLSSRLTDYADQRIEALDLGRGPRRPADRPGPGRRRDEREPAELPGVPRAVRRAARRTCPAGRSRGSRRRSWPPGRWPPSARTSSCPRAWPGRAWP